MALKHRQNDKSRSFGSYNYLHWTEFLKCCVCAKEFNKSTRLPVTLGCCHTYCRLCILNLENRMCRICQTKVSFDPASLPINTAIFGLLSETGPASGNINVFQQNNQYDYLKIFGSAVQSLEEIALYLKPEHLKGIELSRPMQRKLISVLNNQLLEEVGRQKLLRSSKVAAERMTTELIQYHQSPTTLSSSLWDAVRARGCQFLGPAMQEEALKLIQFALGDQSELSRKVLVQLVVEKLQPQFPQASKTSIGHVVQLLYRASCFIVTKRDGDSSLMRLKDDFLGYEELRKEHDAQIVQIAREAGLRISPDQWSALLYGDQVHKSYMQSIIDRLQSGMTFQDSIKDLTVILDRSGDPGSIKHVIPHLNLIAQIDVNKTPDDLETVKKSLSSLNTLIKALADVLKNHQQWLSQAKEATQQCSKYKTSMCRDSVTKGVCPRGEACTFAHNEEELQRYRNKRRKRGMSAFKSKPMVLPENQKPGEAGQHQIDTVSVKSFDSTYVGSSSGSFIVPFSAASKVEKERCHCNCSSSTKQGDEKSASYLASQHERVKLFHPSSEIPFGMEQSMNGMNSVPVPFDKHLLQASNELTPPVIKPPSFKPNQPTSFNQNMPQAFQLPPTPYVNPICHIPSGHLAHSNESPHHTPAAFAVQPHYAYISSLPPSLALQQQTSDMYLHRAAVPLASPGGQYLGHTHKVYVVNSPQGNEPVLINPQPAVVQIKPKTETSPPAAAESFSDDKFRVNLNNDATLSDLRRRKNEVISKIVQKQIQHPNHELKAQPKGIEAQVPSSSIWSNSHQSTTKSNDFDSKWVPSCTPSTSSVQISNESYASNSSLWSNDLYSKSLLSHSHTNGSTSCTKNKDSIKVSNDSSGYDFWNSFDDHSHNLFDSDKERCVKKSCSQIKTTEKCQCDDCNVLHTKTTLQDVLSDEGELVPIQNLRIVSKYGPIARTVRSKTTPAVPKQVQSNDNTFTTPMASNDKRVGSNFSLFKTTKSRNPFVADVEPTSLEHPLSIGFSPSCRVNDEVALKCINDQITKDEHEEDLRLAMELQQIEIEIQSKLKEQ